MRRSLLAGLLLLLAAAAEGSPPNILLLVAEDMGPRVRAFGDPVAVTPHLDRLAAEGTRYPHTFTAAGVCAPSRAALVTGVHPIALGAQHMRTSDRAYRAVPPPAVKAFPEQLRAAGYYTYTDTKLDYQFSGVRSGSGPFTIWDAEGWGTHWRARPDGAPFFGLVNFQITHESVIFPRGVWPRSGLHLGMQLLYGWLLLGQAEVVTPEQVVVPPYYPDTPVVRRDLARHYNDIHRMDEQVGELLAELEADGLAESTVVIWTTDHGDGLPRAKREIYDSGIRVPLIVRWPEALRPPSLEPGGVDERLVSTVDLAPTILGLAGLPVPEFVQGRGFAGPAEGPRRRTVFATKDRMDEVVDRQRAVRDARFKLIRNGRPAEAGAQPLAFRDQQDLMRELWRLHEADALEGPQKLWFRAPRPTVELYDTWEDPHEVRNLADDPSRADTRARLAAALDAWEAEQGERGLISEAELIERMWPGGDEPVTAPPEAAFRSAEGRALLVISCDTEGASLAWRRSGESRWRIYRGPARVASGARLELRAVRYGYAASQPVEAVAP